MALLRAEAIKYAVAGMTKDNALISALMRCGCTAVNWELLLS
jgi:hypothetical protein